MERSPPFRHGQELVPLVPLSKISELVTRASGMPSTAAWHLEATDPATFSGLGGTAGMKALNNLKKKVSDKPVARLDKGPLPSDLLEAAKSKLLYEEIKEVKVKKVMVPSNWLLSLRAGFTHSQKIVFDRRAVDDAGSLIKSTPHAQKLKE